MFSLFLVLLFCSGITLAYWGFRGMLGPREQNYPPNWLYMGREMDGLSRQERLAFIRRNIAATVSVICPPNGGSGVIVGPRHVLTVDHVTRWGLPMLILLRKMDDDGLTVRRYRFVPVRLVARSGRADVALLKILPWCRDLPAPLPLAKDWSPALGQIVWHFGVTSGWVFGRLKNETPRLEEEWYGYVNALYETTCKSRQGDSGGPMVTRDGELIGLVTAGREFGPPLTLFIPLDDVFSYLPEKAVAEFIGENDCKQKTTLKR